MEVCGGQTHTLMRYGIDELLPSDRDGAWAGCPVCVTPLEMVDKAIGIASLPGVIFTSYGDMLRVPGSESDLFQAKAKGADVRVVYSPLDALKIARDNPIEKWFSSELVSRPRRRPTVWLFGKPSAKDFGTSPCWFRMSWCRPPCGSF